MCTHCDYLEGVLDATASMLRVRDSQYINLRATIDGIAEHGPSDAALATAIREDDRYERQHARHEREMQRLRRQPDESMKDWHERTTTEEKD